MFQAPPGWAGVCHMAPASAGCRDSTGPGAAGWYAGGGGHSGFTGAEACCGAPWYGFSWFSYSPLRRMLSVMEQSFPPDHESFLSAA
ncbi:hypothetical protein GCM10010350_44880 [Streptomyces galilaeus]|nr:hypothetical protein GCM10010350_44880 [Streptomyces galilaeus]